MSGVIEGLQATQFWLLWSGLAGVAVLSLWGFLHWLRHSRLLEDNPSARIRNAPAGYVELAGTAAALPGEPVRAPLSGRECAWWSYRIEERSRHRRGQQGWHVVESGVSDAIFALRDASGESIVDPEGAVVQTPTRLTWYGNARHPRRDRRHVARTGRYRYVERRIDNGSTVHAIGYLRGHDSIEEQPPSEQLTTLLKEWKRDRAGLLARFDSDRDGEIDSQEWENARRAARAELARRREAAPWRPRLAVLGQPPDGRSFLIAVGAQAVLTRRWRRYSLLCAVFFVLTAAAAGWMLGVRLPG
jgi:hypothetical protein